MKKLLEEMTWPEIKEALESGMDTVIIYAGSVEQHGPHLAEITDTTLAYAQALDLAERLGNALVAPVIRPGLSAHHMVLPGSLTLRPEVFAGIVEDYISCYESHGFKSIILASSHGGNFKTLEEIARREALKYPHLKIISGCSLEQLTEELSRAEKEAGLCEGACGGHACAWETSIMLKVAPQHVRVDKVTPGFVGKVTKEKLEEFFTKGVTAVTENGVMGDPTVATKELGEEFFKGLQDVQEKVVRTQTFGNG